MPTKAECERAVFREFAEACRLPIDLLSIESREPPEADILCSLASRDKLAFELVEVIDSGVAAALRTTIELPRLLKKQCPPLPGLGAGSLVAIDFVNGSTRRGQVNAFPELFEELKRIPVAFDGDWPLTSCIRRSGISRIGVSRGSWDWLEFQVSPVTSFEDPIIDQLVKKFGKAYRASCPIELLMYYDFQPCDLDTTFGPDLAESVAQGISDSAFRRVWVFERRSGQVWEYPGRASAPGWAGASQSGP